MQPVIAITASLTPIQNDSRYAPFEVSYVPHQFVKAVVQAGGIPVILPADTRYPLDALMNTIDGLILTGGYDINPRYYQEEPHRQLGSLCPERDSHELRLTKKFMATGKPILGICRGMQLINVIQGGTLYQDLSQIDHWSIQHVQKSEIEHPTHSVSVIDNSRLAQLLQDGEYVNSLHHQAIKELGKDLKITALSQDKLIEAIESTHPDLDILAVQWHPELTFENQASSLAIFEDLVNRSLQKMSKNLR